MMENIKVCRKARHMNQQGPCRRHGCRAIDRPPCGKPAAVPPDREMILKLAAFFGVTTDYLLGYEKPSDAPSLPPTDDEIKFALFGGDGEITDAMYKEVQRFARMVKIREEYDRQLKAAQAKDPAEE